ncbi:MAG: hypothetical protein ACRDR6_14245 [Pseudonocardiaceae bacterium]
MAIFSAVSPWAWFVTAGCSAVSGSVLLALDRGHHSAHQRERRRWAALRGWRFVLSDPTLADRWCHGALAQGAAGLAKDIVVGSLFTPLGRRVAQVFDHEQGGQVSSVVVAVRRRDHSADLVVELWLPDQSMPDQSPTRDAALSMLEPVGDRVALVSDPDRARALVSPEFVFAVGALGPDIPVAWVENGWVLASAPCGATPARLERLLRALDELADLLDVAEEPFGFVDSADWATS